MPNWSMWGKKKKKPPQIIQATTENPNYLKAVTT